MVSLFFLFKDLFTNGSEIEVRRLPVAKTLRSHLLGLSFAIFFALLATLKPSPEPFFYFILMLLGSYFGGIFILFSALTALIGGELLGINSGFWGHYADISWWYLGGYMCGALIATLYNDLKFGYLVFIDRKSVKTVFMFDREKSLNIIKDPADPPENIGIRFKDIRKVFRILSKEQMFVVTQDRLDKIDDGSVAAGLAPLLGKTYRGVSRFKKAIESTSNQFRAVYTPDMLLHFFESNPQPGYCDFLETLECANGDDFEKCLTALATWLEADPASDDHRKGLHILRGLTPFLFRYAGLENPNLYTYPSDPPPHPYTIAFVANPYVRVGKGESVEYVKDPIIENQRLFLNSLHQALEVFERNEVLGRPEIWPRIRIVALFDGSLATRNDGKDYAMLQEYPHGVRTDDTIAENLLDPMTSMKDTYERMLFEAGLKGEELAKLLRETDVIFALSANTEFDRSTAHFSDWIEEDGGFRITESVLKNIAGDVYTPKVIEKLEQLKHQVFISGPRFIQAARQVVGENEWRPEMTNLVDHARLNPVDAPLPVDPNSPPDGKDGKALRENFGVTYRFEVDPDGAKRENGEINAVRFLSSGDGDNALYQSEDGRFSCIHEYYSVNPGRIALNVLGADQKTYIHEFAHAMSSAFHGAIVDEYFDSLEIDEDVESEGPNQPPFYVNRVERRAPDAGKVVPIHRRFARLNGQDYLADREHPSARDNWRGYFPDRRMPSIPCTMDQSDHVHRFDELLGTFIYDRLLAKINRPAYQSENGNLPIERAVVNSEEN